MASHVWTFALKCQPRRFPNPKEEKKMTPKWSLGVVIERAYVQDFLGWGTMVVLFRVTPEWLRPSGMLQIKLMWASRTFECSLCMQETWGQPSTPKDLGRNPKYSGCGSSHPHK